MCIINKIVENVNLLKKVRGSVESDLILSSRENSVLDVSKGIAFATAKEGFAFSKGHNSTRDYNIVLSLCGASAGEKILAVYSLGKKCVIVCNNIIDMQEYKLGLESLGLKVGEVFCSLEAPTYKLIKDNTVKLNVIKNIYDFNLNKLDVLLISPEVLLYKFGAKFNTKKILRLEKNKEYSFLEIQQKLIQNGYKKCEKIEKVGDFSIKGDIVDVFLPNFDVPVRLDFFGDTLENIFTFDIAQVKKMDDLDFIYLYPLVYYSLNAQEKQELIGVLKKSILNGDASGDVLIKNASVINQIADGLECGIVEDDEEFLKPFLEKTYSIFELLDSGAVVVDEPIKLQRELIDIHKSALNDLYDFIASGELLNEHSDYLFDVNNALNFKPNLILSALKQDLFKANVVENVRTIGTRKYVFDYKALVSDLFIYERSKYKIVLFAGSEEAKLGISEFLTKYGILPVDKLNISNSKFQIFVTSEKFNNSFSFLDAGIIGIGTNDLVKKSKSDVKNIIKNKKRKVFYLPKVGDLVVHETHGIGRCVSLEKLNLNGSEKDYFIIEYDGGDKLYLPSEQADLISAYVCGEKTPKLNKIGGEQFAKIKQRVKESVSKLAINLIEIYAKREKTKGFVYSKDNALFNEFENAFKFTETEDQQNAINDIKKDMESAKIMDRLICGDVGYGKTEVALRAIYKAILDGRQVAFLCPTTILSEQHYNTAKERFADFMVNVAVLNRFKTKSQQEQILKELKDGKIDLIIGTHRLLSGDVAFKNLGLLVLDEEQRFGVADKEKIKTLKENVDVLTLSATPIPRTLNMALTGIRDISIIATPPKERIAVKTYVQEESDALILNACKKELLRGGQVLVVFNRVENIEFQAQRIRQLIPNAKVGVAHGQMPEKLLEQTILKLYNHEFDILVATTLIESGIDLPKANTLIVLDADRLGLSELYQLRGRIGRSDKVAYAYFTYNPAKLLTNDAYKRLEAILEYSELGSGFKIAMRDLEIRGAGDILGKEQHGHLEKVGYDLYCKLLNSAVKELKGESVKETKPIKIDITVSANLPEFYVASEDERIKLYSSISTICSDGEHLECLKVLKEAYGEPPQEVVNLLKIAYIKNLGIKNGVKRILLNGSACKIYLYKKDQILAKEVADAFSNYKNGVLKFEDVPELSFELGLAEMNKKIDFVLNFLKGIKTI